MITDNIHSTDYQSKIDRFLDGAASKGGALTGLAVMLASLIISFATLQQTAADYGFNWFLAILWPLLIDGIILSQSLVVLRRERLGFSTRFNWFLLLVFEAASLFINGYAGWVLGSSPAQMLTGAMVHGLPPLALFLISKSMAHDIKDSGQLSGTLQTLSELQAAITEIGRNREQAEAQAEAAAQAAQGRIEALQAEIENLEAKKSSVDGELQRLRSERTKEKRAQKSGFVPGDIERLAEARDVKQDRIAERRAKVAELLADGESQAEMARRLKVSTDTIRRDIKAIRQSEEDQAANEPQAQLNGHSSGAAEAA